MRTESQCPTGIHMKNEKPCEMIFMSDRPVVNCGWVTPFKEFLQEQIKKTLSIGKISIKNGWSRYGKVGIASGKPFAAVADENGCRASFLWELQKKFCP